MIFALIGLIWIIAMTMYNKYPETLIGFGFIGFDLTIEIVNLKTQLWAVGKGISDELIELRKKVEK